MRFSEYAFKKDELELVNFLTENGIELETVNIKFLIESGWWDKTKQGLKRGLRTGALLAAMPAISGANWMPPQELPNPQPYRFSVDRLMDNEQSVKDQAADKAYVDAGGPEFKQTLKDAEEFAKFQRTPQHKEILKRAGLPNNYIPSPVRSFAYGDKVSTAESYTKEAVEVIQNGVRKHFGRDSFVRFVKSEDSVTGGSVILLDVTGTVMAFDEADAVKRVEMIIGEIAKDNGYDLAGFQNMSKHHGINVKPAPRSTIDYVQESAGRPIRFTVRIKIKK